jgi:excisionase family DNA binding protein
MATSTVSSCVDSSNAATLPSGQHWSVGKVAKYLGVSASQVRILVRAGELVAYVMQSGHRRISVKSVKAFANGGEGQAVGDGEVVGYCRTSYMGQKESLQRQIERLRGEIAEREGIKASSVTIYQECCSSFGERPALQSLVLDVINGKVKKVYVEHYNRLTRVKALGSMLDFLCETYGATIVALDREESADDLKDNIQELIDFVHVLGCRQASEKAKLVTVKHLPVETMERICTLSSAGHTGRDIYRMIVAEGHKTTKGEPISLMKLRSVLKANGVIKSAVGQAKGEQTNMKKFVGNWVKAHVTADDRGRVMVRDMIPKYNRWAESQGKAPLRAMILAKYLIDNGFASCQLNGKRHFKVAVAG